MGVGVAEVDGVVLAAADEVVEGVYRGQRVLVGLHLVMVTKCVMVEVLVVVECCSVSGWGWTPYAAEADMAPTARTRKEEACIFDVLLLLRWF